jgi:hypothetical protein
MVLVVCSEVGPLLQPKAGSRTNTTSDILLYPSKMLYPGVLPLVSMFDTLFTDGDANRAAKAAGQKPRYSKKLKLFWIAFGLSVLSSSFIPMASPRNSPRPLHH